MRGVMALLVWLLSLWTWFRDSIMVGWLKMHPSEEGRVDPRVGVEQLQSNEGQHESGLMTFLSSLPKDTPLVHKYVNNGFQLIAYIDGLEQEFSIDEASHREFLATIASSEVESCSYFHLYWRGFDNISMELKHVEEIMEALASNNNFKHVNLKYFGCRSLQMAKSISKLLLENKAIEYLTVVLRDSKVRMGKKVTKLLANGLYANRTLKDLHLCMGEGLEDDEGIDALVKPLKNNRSVLQHLILSKITDVGLDHLGTMLVTNKSLRTLSWTDRRKGEEYMRGFTSLNKALCINGSLKYLTCNVQSSMELKMLLEPLMPMTTNQQANTTLKTLNLQGCTIGGKEGMDVLIGMIRTNTTLLKLDLTGVRELDDCELGAIKNVLALMEALKSNESLKILALCCCRGVRGYEVVGTMMDMLLENHQLEKIIIQGTPLESSGDAKYVVNELEKRKKKKVWELIKGMANVSPKSGRVFLCGHPRAGKTTLRMSLKKLLEFENQRVALNSLIQRGMKKLKGKFGTSKVTKVPNSTLEMARTRGIEVDHVECDGIGISIWDMAGQTDYHSFHDLVIPNLSADGSCSLFLLICNPLDENLLVQRNISDIMDEVEYWLRFIASNTRPSLRYRPHVSIVMTHKDQWGTQVGFQSRIEDNVAALKLQFEDVLEFDPDKNIFMVNGREGSYAKEVFDFMKNYLKQLLANLPQTLKACSEVQCRIMEWNQEISKQLHGGQTSKLPMLTWEEFSNKFCKGIGELQDGDKELVRRKQEFVAISLNDGGHIMYHEKGEFVITNPHWFCHDIMGEFINYWAKLVSTPKVTPSHGIISIEHVKHILMDILGNQWHEGLLDAILSMMKNLHMCYEQDDKSIMIPSTLQEKEEGLSWLTKFGFEKLVYVGRRLSCKDAKRTMLSLGFFSRLQVSFFQIFKNNNVANSFKLFKDVIMFIYMRVEVIIEFNNVDVDIMLRSGVCQDEVLGILENVIVRHIQDMLMNPTLGCPGVILVEYILRPECIEKLVDMKERKDQYVAMEELELEVVTCGFDATHNWKGSGHMERGFDEVRDLLGNKAWAKLLKKQHDNLVRLEGEILQMSGKEFQRDGLIGEKGMGSRWGSMVSQTFRKPIKLVGDILLEDVYQRLDVVIEKIEDIQQIQEKILKMQNDLLREVSIRIEDLMGFSMNMHHFPKTPYLTKVGQKKLLTRIVPDLEEFVLHLMCESRDGIHVVVGQKGCKVYFGTGKTRTFLTMFKCGLNLLTILLKIGAHVVGGMGEMVPDLNDVARCAGLVLDTPNLIDQTSLLCSDSLPVVEKGNSTITKEEKLEVEKWLIDVLEPKCKEKSTFYEMFRLRKVVYRGDGSRKQSIAWLCEDCEKKSMRGLLRGAMYYSV